MSSSRDSLYSTYGAHPSHVHEHRGRDLDPVYRAHLRGWLPAEREAPLLDLGCGDGALLAFLQREGYTNLVGVDRAAGQVERARAAAPAAEVVLGVGDGHLEAHREHYAVIFCMDVLEHLDREELLETVRRARRALRPGGWLVARVPNADSPFHDAILYGDLTHEMGFAPPALVHLFRATGFEGVEFREAAPVLRGVKSALRALAWRFLRQMVRLWNLVETGSSGAGVYTRVAYVRARRPLADHEALG